MLLKAYAFFPGQHIFILKSIMRITYFFFLLKCPFPLCKMCLLCMLFLSFPQE